MKTIKIFAILVSLVFLMSSCYTQLALVKHETPQQQTYYSGNDNDEYYYPPSSSDTIYEEESPEIVQNFYLDNPYYDPYDFSMNIGFYSDWWWNDFYYTSWPFIGFRPLRPILLYPVPYWGFYDPFYWDPYVPYYNPWYYSGPAYGTPYGPRPFSKGGSLVRGGGSKRVRISHNPGSTIGRGPSTFLPTRASGNATSKNTSITIRKRSSDRRTVIGQAGSGRTVLRKGTTVSTKNRSTVIKRRGSSSRTIISKRSGTTRGRRYFPITVNRKTKRQTVVNQTKPHPQSRIKASSHRSTRYRNSGTYESHRWTPPSRSSTVNTGRSRPSYSTPSRSTSVRSTPTRSSSSSRSSGSRRAVRKK